MIPAVTLLRAAAPRKAFDRHPVPALLPDPYHVAAAFTYGRLCSPKRLAYAWHIDASTARKYQRGDVVGALTRIAWEIALLERAGVSPRPIFVFLFAVARHERRRARA